MMRNAIRATLAAAALTACVPSDGRLDPSYVVSGVEDGDMLKLRAGPGTGFRVILGVPNGTVLRIYGCEQTGSTRWCKASVTDRGAVTGYVSWAYLRAL